MASIWEQLTCKKKKEKHIIWANPDGSSWSVPFRSVTRWSVTPAHSGWFSNTAGFLQFDHANGYYSTSTLKSGQRSEDVRNEFAKWIINDDPFFCFGNSDICAKLFEGIKQEI